MPILINNFNWGSDLTNNNPDLLRQLDKAYTDIANAVNTKPSKYITDGVFKPHVDPPASSQFNENFSLADIYVRTDTDTAWIMTSRTDLQNVIWTIIT